jgi:ectoine hydroxylase-related dioxygenase (phytanoyl-CoA dioxygenase family)
MKLNHMNYNEYNNGSFAVKVNTGELILFPSTTRHSVPINTLDDTRYSLSFNTFTSSQIGSTDQLTYLNLKEIANASA